jgi:predicted oxidoreductase
MVTVGGLWVDGEQRVLGENWKPIKGLFATGNTTSGRFGRDYFTPLMGVSIGMAVCLGREAGISVGKQIRGEIFYL